MSTEGGLGSGELGLDARDRHNEDRLRGIAGVLTAAGRECSFQTRVCFLFAPLLAILGLVGLRLALVNWWGIDAVVVQLGFWTVWLLWLGWIFPRSRRRYMHHNPDTAYRRALRGHILFLFAAITTINTAPAHAGAVAFLRTGQWSSFGVFSIGSFLLAAVIAAAGAAVIVVAIRTIGLPAAAFAEEYRTCPPPHTVGGIYRYIRHPIAVGGMIMPAAAALHGGLALTLWLVNLAMLVPYGLLEDHRLRRVFGSANDTYMSGVRRFLPVPATVKSARGR
ncbi:hypothetical protein BVU76_04010 [Mycolicibacterium porcinum]|nr:hypothetical protein BVU76_04010 [Mycolicibacterium porcinum]